LGLAEHSPTQFSWKGPGFAIYSPTQPSSRDWVWLNILLLSLAGKGRVLLYILLPSLDQEIGFDLTFSYSV
jgi:hypothetical protein